MKLPRNRLIWIGISSAFVIYIIIYTIIVWDRNHRALNIPMFSIKNWDAVAKQANMPVYIDWDVGTRNKPRQGKKMRIVFLSDTHARHDRAKIPHGDVLIHCGDMTDFGRESEILAFNEYLTTLPHKHKIAIFGNHEEEISKYTKDEIRAKFITNAVYLEDEMIQIDGVKIYGTPWVPNMYGLLLEKQKLVGYKPNGISKLSNFDNQFYFKSDQVLQQKWRMIPEDVDILITHSAALDMMDWNPVVKHGVGCPFLRDRVTALRSKNLAIHAFGHLHENYGLLQQAQNDTLFMNAAVSTNHQPFVVDFHY